MASMRMRFVSQMRRCSLHITAAQLPRPMSPYRTEVAPNAEMGLGQVEVQLAQQFKMYRLTEGPDTLVAVDKVQAAFYYRQMKMIRAIETAAGRMYRERLVRGFCHLYSGQEACAVGIRAAMRPEDNVIAAYRIHGWAYLMGVSAAGVLAELTGRSSGCARGKGGSMHMYAPHFYGGNGIVGAQVPIGAGIALACKYKQDGGVCLALYGDGAANQGQVAETFNMAQLWQLPIVFVVENNNYAMGTSAKRGAFNPKFYTRGDLMPGIWVDGMDVLAVRSATRYAIDFALNRGPMLLELCTYRYGGHSMADPGTNYRSREEVKAVRNSCDAIDGFAEICRDHELLTETDLEQIDLTVRDEITAAVEKAREDSELPLEDLGTQICACDLEPELRGIMGYRSNTTNSDCDEIKL